MSILASALLAGSKLGNAIKSHGKAAATFREREHVLAASALNHLQEHGGVEHIQALYEMTPSNYRPALRQWATEFGRCTFKAIDEKTKKPLNVFVYAKGKAGNMAGALAISPAEFAKAPAARVAGQFDYVAKVESIASRIEKLIEEFEGNNVPMAAVAALEALHEAAKRATTNCGKVRTATAKPVPVVIEGGKGKAAPAAAKAAKPAKAAKAAKAAPAAEVAPEAAAA